jgi:hypothetical protein
METPICTETATHQGRTITVKWYHDPDYGPPWQEEDGHGPVSEWVHRDKRPGERTLCADRSSKRFYDFQAAIALAKRDGWDAPPYQTGTPGEQAVRAVEADFDWLRRWCQDDWHWVGHVVTIAGVPAFNDSCCGFDSDSIPELTAECFRGART